MEAAVAALHGLAQVDESDKLGIVAATFFKETLTQKFSGVNQSRR
jgi:hypothetical protein